MLTPASTNLISRVGDDFSLVISVTDGAGDPFDFTGCTGLFRVYNKIGTTLLDKTSTGDAANVALTSGTITVTLPRDDSEYAVLPAGEYRWEIAITLSTGELQTWIVGDFVHQARRGAPGTQSNTLSAEITSTTVTLTVLTPSTVIPISQKGAVGGIAFNNVIHVDSYSVSRDGSETLTQFNQAVTAAAAAGLPLHLGAGGTIKLSPSTTIDLSGIPALLGDAVTLDVSGATASPIFAVEGSRTAIASAKTITEEQRSITVNTGLTIPRGSRILITSVEALPNAARSSYYKGEWGYVDSYDDVTGELVLMSGTEFSYTASAYLWSLDEASLDIASGISFQGLDGGTQACLAVTYAKANVEASFKNFGNAALRYIASRGRFSGIIEAVYYAGSTNSYGVAVLDLSDVDLVAAQITGCRHCTMIGGGVWDAGDSGGTPGDDAAYPSSRRIIGGRLVATRNLLAYAADAHGVGLDDTYVGVEIDGGVTPGARRTKIVGCRITHDSQAGIYVGTDSASTDWGEIEIDAATEIVARKQGSTYPAYPNVFINGDIKRLRLNGTKLRGDWNSSTADSNRTPIRIDGNVADIDLSYDCERADTSGKESIVRVYDRCRVRRVRQKNNQLYITPLSAGKSITVESVEVEASPNYGLYLDGSSFEWERVTLRGVDARECQRSGVLVRVAKDLRIEGGRLNDNGANTSAATSERAGLSATGVARLTINGLDCRDTGVGTQRYGIYHTAHAALDTKAQLVGVDSEGNTSANVIAGTVLHNVACTDNTGAAE